MPKEPGSDPGGHGSSTAGAGFGAWLSHLGQVASCSEPQCPGLASGVTAAATQVAQHGMGLFCAQMKSCVVCYLAHSRCSANMAFRMNR